MTISFNRCLSTILHGHVDQVMATMDQIDQMTDVSPQERHQRKYELFLEALREQRAMVFRTAEHHHKQNCPEALTATQEPIMKLAGPKGGYG